MNEFLKYNLSWCGVVSHPRRSHQVFSRLSRVGLFVIPWMAACQALLSVGFSRQEYWSRLPCPSPEDLPNPGIEPCDWTHCRQIFYHLCHQGSPRILEWVTYPFSRETSQPRNRTRVSWILGGFFTSWATWEAPLNRYTYTRKTNFFRARTLFTAIQWTY